MASPFRTAEHERIASAPPDRPGDWKAIGPYLSERAWGTVREDYSADGEAWEYFPHEHARSRAYRWSEDGLAGICDLEQRMCFALAFWNGRDPFLKERIFGLDRPRGQPRRGRQGVLVVRRRDADRLVAALALPLPAGRVPVRAAARGERAARPARDREFELVDTGVFDDDRYWQIAADYAKAAPRDLCLRIRVRNAGPEAAELHVLPTLWFRNRWSWEEGVPRPVIRAAAGRDGRGERDRRGGEPRPLAARRRPRPRRRGRRSCSSARTRRTSRACSGTPAQTPYPKDGINDHVVGGAATVNPAQRGTKMACWYRVERRRPARPSSCACGWRATTPAARPTSAPASSARSPTASARPTSSTRRCGPPARPTTRRP